MGVKIIITVGPASNSSDMLLRLKQSDLVSTFRLNLSHLNQNTLNEQIEILISHGITPSIDTQGAQLRVSHLLGGALEVLPGDHLIITGNKNQKKYNDIPALHVNHPEILGQLSRKDELKIDFNGAVCEVLHSDGETVLLNTIFGGKILQNRGLDITGKKLKLNPLTQFDELALSSALEWGVKEVFLSFANTSSDVHYCRSLLPKDVNIISKIESIEGIKNLRDIAYASDSILIDRGDLSREVGIGKLPLLVKSIVQIARECDTDAYVATNILDTMISSPLPSRAEVSDLYSLLDMGVKGIVLAAEVAIGKHPYESIQLVDYIRKLHSYNLDSFALLPELVEELKCNMSEPLRSWL